MELRMIKAWSRLSVLLRGNRSDPQDIPFPDIVLRYGNVCRQETRQDLELKFFICTTDAHRDLTVTRPLGGAQLLGIL